jgi:hypothetical protein
MWQSLIIAALLCFAPAAYATYTPFNTSAAGNIGIGSAAPGARLDVTGTVRALGFAMGTNGPASGYVLTASDSAGDMTWTPTGNIDGWSTGTGTVFTTTGSNNVGIGTSTPQGGFVVTNGNVGIGTWAPGKLLDVYGTLQHFYIAANGNVGIGVASPTQSLSVSGSATIGGTDARGKLTVQQSSTSTFVANTDPQDSGRFLVMENTDTSNTANQFSNITMQIYPGGVVGTGRVLDDIRLVRDAANSTNAHFYFSGFRNDASYKDFGAIGYDTSWFYSNIGIGTSTPQGAFVVTNGNVGIGTWAPMGVLQVNGQANNPFVVTSGGSVGIGTIITQNTLNLAASGSTFTTPGIDFFSTSNSVSPVYNAGRIYSKFDNAAGYISGRLTFASATGLNAFVDTMTIKNNNVGIGTTTPQGAFVVTNGNVGIGTWTAAGGQLIVLGGGNVGVGTAWPGQMMDVQGSVRALGFAMGTNGPASGYVLTASDSAGDATWTPSGNIDGWSTGTGTVFTTTGSNNVGIGTTTPQGGFVVTNGNVGIGTWSPLYQVEIVGIGTSANNSGLSIIGGNLGVGTYNPTARFELTPYWSNIGPSLANAATQFIAGNSTALGTTAGSYAYPFEFDTSTGNILRLQIAPYRRIPGSSWTSAAYRLQYAVDNSFTDGSKSYIEIGSDDVATSGTGGFLAFGTNGLDRMVINSSGAIGIGTATPVATFDVVGNIGVGTNWNSSFVTTAPPRGGMIVQNNVGIGSLAPGQMLDVQGTVRALGFAMGTNGPASGYVLTASDSVGDVTWTAAGSVGPWTQVGTNIYETGNNVGVGTTTPQGGFVVTNGNVGIGTWAPRGLFDVEGTAGAPYFAVNNGNVGVGTAIPNYPLRVVGGVSNVADFKSTVPNSYITLTDTGGTAEISGSSGSLVLGGAAAQAILLRNNSYAVRMKIQSDGNIGIGSLYPGTIKTQLFVGQGVSIGVDGNSSYAVTTAPAGGMIVQGNVGLGSLAPGQQLDVQGTVRALGFAMGTNGPASGYVLTASDSVGDATWTAAGSVGPWTQSGSIIYETGNNIGVGSLAPGTALDVNGTARMTGFALTGQGAAGGNVLVSSTVGVGTWMAGSTVAGSVNGLTTNYLPKASSSTALTNSLIFDNGSNVGIGSANPTAALDINGGLSTGGSGDSYFSSGNLGIGSTAPGTALDVNGTARMGGFTMNNGASSGYVLVTNSVGVGTWMSPSSIGASGGGGGWSTGTGTVYTTTGSDNVGIGTNTPQGGFVVTNGNVGVGTWAPKSTLDVEGTMSLSLFAGNVGIDTASAGYPLVVNGNTYIKGTLYLTAPSAGVTPSLVPNTPDFGSITFSSVFALFTGNTGGLLIPGNHMVGFTSGTNSFSESNLDTGITRNLSGGVEVAAASNASITGLGNLVAANIGIGTTIPVGIFDVEGTLAKTVILGGVQSGVVSVGIGSTAPGQKLDVQGTVRALGFAMVTNGPASGYVLTASDSVGDATWTAAGSVGPWTQVGTNIYETGNNVGIGTTTPQDAFVVTSGNVGIGTWAPGNSLIVMRGNIGIGTALANRGHLEVMSTTNDINGLGTIWAESSNSNTSLILNNTGTNGHQYQLISNNNGIFQIRDGSSGITGISLKTNNGSVGIGTWVGTNNSLTIVPTQFNNGGIGIATIWSSPYVSTKAPVGGMAVEGNIGVGSLAPGQSIDVQGTVRALGFTMGTNSPASGYVLTASDSFGDATWTAAGSVGPWTQAGTNIYETGNNVGIGTTTPQGAFVVTSGSVGIGTWVPAQSLDVGGKSVFRGDLLIKSGLHVTNISGGGSFTIGGAETDTLSLLNGYVTMLRAASNIGIGTTLPVGVLDIEGTANPVIFNGMNVGIGTTTPQGALVVTSGNVGIGTWTPRGLFDVEGTVLGSYFTVNGSGNVGIGTWVPAAPMQINYNNTGTIKFGTVTGQALVGGNAAGNLHIDSTSNLYLDYYSGTNVYFGTGASSITGVWQSTGNVGIGTSTPQGALVVNNGNVGIGTWTTAGGSLIVRGTGNVGIGSAWPGTMLDVQGTVRALGYTTLSGVAAGWTVTGSNVFVTTGSNNVGIGTSTPQGGLVVTNGNVGIGTWAPNGSLIIQGGGNVGIGTAWPGMVLDVNGTFRASQIQMPIGATMAYTFSGSTNTGMTSPAANDLRLLTNGTTNFRSAGNVNYLISNVGIGNNFIVPGNTLSVGGNVGIGTNNSSAYYVSVLPSGSLAVEKNIGIGTTEPTSSLNVASGNVGVGTAWPGTLVDVNGTVRALGFAMGTNAPASGYVLTASDSAGDTTWTAPGNIAGWSTGTGTVYTTTGSNNVGIGTTTPQGGLVVTNGNVGVGTWSPRAAFDVEGTLAVSMFAGNVGIGTLSPGAFLDVKPNAGAPDSSNGFLRIYTPYGGPLFTGHQSGAGYVYANTGIFQAITDNTTTLTNTFFQGITGNTTQFRVNSDGSGYFAGNVGIGTTTPQGGLVVTNGNVGIGTWAPKTTMDVEGTMSVAFFNGNVGMGTFVPSAPLEIKLPVLTSRDNNNQEVIISNGGQNGLHIGYNSTSGYALIDALDPLVAWRNLILQDSGTAAGNVGIGTTGPLGKLVVIGGNVGIGTILPANVLDVHSNGVNGNINELMQINPGTENLGTAGSGATIAFKYLGATYAGAIGGYGTGSATGMGIWSGSGSGAPSVYVTGGNVGIGTTLQSNLFEVGAQKFDITSAGNVGIGTTLPSSQFEVGAQNFDVTSAGNVGIGSNAPGALMTLNYTNASGTTPAIMFDNPSATGQNVLLFRSANTSRGIIRSDYQGNIVLSPGSGGNTYLNYTDLGTPGDVVVQSGSFMVGTTNTNPASNDSPGVYIGQNGYISADFNGGGSAYLGRSQDGTIVAFYSNAHLQGTISISGATTSYNAFTGSHYTLLKGRAKRDELVILTGENTYIHGKPPGEVVYGVKISTKANDSTVLGSYEALQDPMNPRSLDNPDLVSAVGNGQMWVVDTGKNIELGDLLISSDVPGHAMLDPGTYPVSHILAHSGEHVDWSKVTAMVNGKKHKSVSVFYEFYDKVNASTAQKNGGEIEELKAQNKDLKTRDEQKEIEIRQLEFRVDHLERMLTTEENRKKWNAKQT